MPGKKGPRFSQAQILAMPTIRTDEQGDQLKYENARARIWVRPDSGGVPLKVVFQVYRQRQWGTARVDLVE